MTPQPARLQAQASIFTSRSQGAGLFLAGVGVCATELRPAESALLSEWGSVVPGPLSVRSASPPSLLPPPGLRSTAQTRCDEHLNAQRQENQLCVCAGVGGGRPSRHFCPLSTRLSARSLSSPSFICLPCVRQNEPAWGRRLCSTTSARASLSSASGPPDALFTSFLNKSLLSGSGPAARSGFLLSGDAAPRASETKAAEGTGLQPAGRLSYGSCFLRPSGRLVVAGSAWGQEVNHFQS